jgi:hypothetical protein
MVAQSKLSEVQAELLMYQVESAQYVTDDADDPVTTAAGVDERSGAMHSSVPHPNGAIEYERAPSAATSAGQHPGRAATTVIAAGRSTAVTALSQRELLLNTIPYFQTIARGLRAAAAVTAAGDGYSYSGNYALQATGMARLPVYSERVDWLLEHINSADSTPVAAHLLNASAAGSCAHASGYEACAAASEVYGDARARQEEEEEADAEEIGEFD